MSIKKQVETLMARNKLYRNDDKALIVQIWSDNGFKLTRYQKFMFIKSPSADVILRRRRELSAKYPASPEVLEHRYKHYKALTEEFSGGFVRRILHRRGIV